jgi:hypothetical protein
MPRPKRYAPLSQDFLDDPEVWELMRLHGDRAVLTALWVICAVDRHENRVRLSGDWLAILSRRTRQTVAKVRAQLEHMVSTEWITLDHGVSTERPTILRAVNYSKYHSRQVHKGSNPVSTSGTDMFPSDPIRSDPEKMKNPPKAPLAGVGSEGMLRFEEFWKVYPPRNGKKLEKATARRLFLKLTPEDQTLCIAAARAYAKYCKDGEEKPRNAHRFIAGEDGEYWREHIPAQPSHRPAVPVAVPSKDATPMPPEVRDKLNGTRSGKAVLAIVDRATEAKPDAPAAITTSGMDAT